MARSTLLQLCPREQVRALRSHQVAHRWQGRCQVCCDSQGCAWHAHLFQRNIPEMLHASPPRLCDIPLTALQAPLSLAFPFLPHERASTAAAWALCRLCAGPGQDQARLQPNMLQCWHAAAGSCSCHSAGGRPRSNSCLSCTMPSQVHRSVLASAHRALSVCLCGKAYKRTLKCAPHLLPASFMQPPV